jgi:hypothetical protein
VRIFRKSIDSLLFTSALTAATIPGLTSASIPTLSAWSPPAPADADYFIVCTVDAQRLDGEPLVTAGMGAQYFDLKPGPIGPAPEAHAPTHSHGGLDPLPIEDLGTAELDVGLILRPNGTGGVEFASPPCPGTTTTPFLSMSTAEMLAIPFPSEGMAVWNTTEHQLYVYDGSGWVGVVMQA